MRVLALDRELDWDDLKRSNCYVSIAGKRYKAFPNSIKSWIAIISTESFAGQTVEFNEAEPSE